MQDDPRKQRQREAIENAPAKARGITIEREAVKSATVMRKCPRSEKPVR